MSSDLPHADRRKFLKGAALTGAAALAPAAAPARAAPPHADLKAAAPGPKLVAAETQPPAKDPVNQTSSGGEFMVDVLKALDFDYLAINCASSFRGIHEAIVNYGGNKPEILTCPHEEIAVHMAGLRQDRRQADRHDVPRHRRPAARRDGALQFVVRPRAGLRDDWQYHRSGQARARR